MESDESESASAQEEGETDPMEEEADTDEENVIAQN